MKLPLYIHDNHLFVLLSEFSIIYFEYISNHSGMGRLRKNQQQQKKRFAHLKKICKVPQSAVSCLNAQLFKFWVGVNGWGGVMRF
jgi:hypothetical protein